MELRFLKTAAIGELVRAIPENLKRYTEGDFADLELDAAFWSFQSRDGCVNLQDLESLLLPDENSNYEVENSVRVFEAFPKLSRYEAADVRLWTFYNHATALDYTRARYGKKVEGKDLPEQCKEIEKHFFASSSARDLVRNGSLSRLWWNARVCFDASPKNGHELLRVLLINTDFRASHMERTSEFATNAFKASMLFALEKFKADPSDLYFIAPRSSQKLSDCTHYNYRHALKFLNRVGGWLNLSLFSAEQLVDMLKNDEEKFCGVAAR